MTTVNIENLHGVVPDNVIAELPTVMELFEINTPLRVAHFLAQCAHESNGFKAIKENLNYSAEGLKTVFKHFFPTDVLAEAYARQPEKIASRAYAGRNGNGDEASHDGWTYCGRGYIQLTGKANYASFSKSVSEDCVANPDLVSTKYPLASAGWFFMANHINSVSDRGSSVDVVTSVTKIVNGGTNGLNDRIARFNTIYAKLSQ